MIEMLSLRPRLSSVGFLLLATVSAALAADEPFQKVSPPDAMAEADATKLVKDVYGGEVAAAKTADRKKALAAKILQLAKENENDPAGRYVLLRLAKNIAMQASDFPTALAAIDEIDKSFQIDPIEMKAEVLRKCATTPLTSEQHAALAQQAADICHEAVSHDSFALAIPLVDLAIGEAKKAKDDPLGKRLVARRAEIEAIVRAHEAVKASLATLATSPTDAAANLTVGKYTCFVKADWQHGLPMLALGSDPALKALAEEEIKGVASSEEQEKLGDSWWNAAEAASGFEKRELQSRAAHWYESALPALSGLPKDKAASRLRKIQQERPTIYLAELEALEVRVNGPPEYHDFRTNFHGKMSPHTIWGHPPADNSSSHLAFQLDGQYHTFRGDAGISRAEKQDPDTPLTFRIVGDGKLLWKSKPLQARDSSNSFRVNVTKIQKLELFVDCPGSPAYAWALWIDPLLER
jgi:hypothetical protein